ncbi:MAG: FAD-dependent oxidoreductase [Chitinophagaceae bacterium]
MKKIGLKCFLYTILSIGSYKSEARFKEPYSPKANTYTVDVCIYGGTAGGVIAAYTAKKYGKSVILIEPGKMLGGMTTGGLGQTDIGNKQAITGLSRQFYQKVGKKYGVDEQWTFEPHVAQEVLDEYIKLGNIEVLFEKQVTKVNKKGQVIQSILVKDPENKNTATLVVNAKEFIDCTYEGDLMALAGVSYVVGREDNKQYNETLNGFQLPEYFKQSGKHQFPDGVDPYKTPGVPSSGLLYGISTEKVKPTGSGDNKVQTYNFRICLTDSIENSIPISRPADYDSTRYELLIRLFAAQPNMRKINDYFIWSLMPNRKTDINNRGGFSTDMIGENYRWSEGNYEQRKKIFNDHFSYTKGLLYFVKTDKRVPEQIQQYINRWGYPKDEYKSFGNFTPQLYVREARRMVGEYVMTEHNCVGKEKVTDGIGQAAYTMDSHNIQRIVVNGMVKNEGNVEVGNFPPYPVSFRSLTPKRSECTNLLVPVCLSSSHIAYGSIRMEPVFMVLGQSSALAACMAIDEKVAVQKININKLQNLLQSDPYLERIAN